MEPDSFAALQSHIQESRDELDELRAALRLAADHVHRTADAQVRLDRTFRQDDRAAQAERRRLQAQHKSAIERVDELRKRIIDAERVLHETLDEFAQFSDPRRELARLDDAFPILLVPLRLETRFRQVAGREGRQHQLWVRVYPDDCAVDTFERELSEAEVLNARHYWAEVWRAGEDEAQLRAAWRGLVASHGPGRALWIVEQYKPLGGATPPPRDPGDVVLVIAAAQPPAPPSDAELTPFWEAIWRAGDDTAAQQAAQQALAAQVGNERAALIIGQYRPVNLGDQPPAGTSRHEAVVRVVTVDFAAVEETVRRRSWTRAPHVSVMPDRLVLIGYAGGKKTFEEIGNLIPSPLVVGPDPMAAPADGIHQEHDDITVSEEMRWMVDFNDAIAKGMGFRVGLTPEQYARGFDRLIVLGVRMTADEHAGRKEIERLLLNHQHSRAGLALLRQGTPTNNTDDGDAAWSASTDPDAGFAILSSGGLFEREAAWFARTDGQWLSDMLGIDTGLLQRVDGANHTEVIEAQAINAALFPATIGYFMDTMMSPVFEDADVDFVRDFFRHFVSGRGMLGAIRIGSQPYGILPATVYSRMTWRREEFHLASALDRSHVEKLHEVLMRAHSAWGDLLSDVSYIGKPGNPHQMLLHVLGLHATSMEFDQRWTESLEQVINRLNLQGWLGRLMERLRLLSRGPALLADSGHDPATQGRPDILDMFFLRTPTPVDASNLIHDQPLSETEGIRAYTTDDRDYIEWLADVAKDGLEAVRTHAGFASPPTALLYRMLRHAITLGHHDAAVRLNRSVRDLPVEEVRLLRRDPSFIHVSGARQTSESRFELLYADSSPIGGGAGLNVADYVSSLLGERTEVAWLTDQLDALQRLRGLPSARLERLLVEHLDTCSYRLDAWLQGLVHMRLALMRSLDSEGQPRQGLYLGAFGWLEDLRPSGRTRQPVRLTEPDLADVFHRPGEEPLMRDRDNAGFVHAPSPNHAVTAAVLRSAYRSTAAPAHPGPMAVNLSSERVRRAMAVIDGICNGQSLGALLGYQLERGLHDRHAEAEVDSFIFKLRKAFPLVADNIRDTSRPVDDNVPDTEESIEAVEARNVINGVKLAEHIRTTGNRTYPFGKSWLPPADAPQQAVIDTAVERMLDTHDAVADVGVAEGIHHVVQGNYDRAAATMDAFTGGGLPPIPDVVATPRSGIGLTHRVGLHFRPGLSHTASPLTIALTPRAIAEPALNHWLASRLPDPAGVGVYVEWSDGTGASGDRIVTQAELGLQPIDLLYLLNTEGDQAMSAVDDRIVLHIAAGRRPDVRIRIRYTERLAPPLVSLFEVGALISELRLLLFGARPLRASDMALPNDAAPAPAALPEYEPDRLTHVRDDITDAEGPLEALRTLAADLKPLIDDAAANRAVLIADVDDRIMRFVTAAAAIGMSGVTRGGFGSALNWKRERYSALLGKVAALLERWQRRLDTFDTMLGDYDFLPPATTQEARFAMLAEIEALVAVLATSPLPATPAAYRAELDTARAEFDAKRTAFATVLDTSTPDLAALLAEIGHISADANRFDTVKLDLEMDKDEIVRYAEDLFVLANSMVTEADENISTADAALGAYAAAGTAADREAAFAAAAHALLGEEFLTVPEFSVSNSQAAELGNAYDARASLLAHLGTLNVEFPVDEWLYGVARVRPPMQHWETATMLVDAFGQGEMKLEPLQLPHQVSDSWLALEHDPTTALDTDRLLHTAHFAQALDTAGPQCGLLLDEWTEVIPATDETTGVSFQYDRPNSEPPQVMLLAASPALNGRWEWTDLVDTLHETLELAKRRAVEPDHLAGTDYAHFLPATISAATMSPITIALNYAISNNVYRHIKAGGSDD